MRGYTQTDIEGFKQASVSKIESRNDIKLTTLIEYLHAINMDLEVRALSRPKNNEMQENIILISPKIEEENLP